MGPSNRAAGGDRVPVSGAAIAAGAAAQVVTDGGSLAPEVSPGGDTNATMGATTAGDPATSTGPVGGASPSTAVANDGDIMEESGVIRGTPYQGSWGCLPRRGHRHGPQGAYSGTGRAPPGDWKHQ
jgi:hypothetical protein